jgi:flagellum-specific peptidoglycan hydrolase FlgJ
MIRILFISLFLFSNFFLFPQNKAEVYISSYKDIAVAEMNQFGIPASITLAQGILESGNGESRLATEGKNHFGIKCHDNWNGETIIEDDDEKGECFRKYEKVADSYRDHSLFLTQRERYASLFSFSPTNYKEWAKGLKKAGYATNPKYPSLLIDLIVLFLNCSSGKGVSKLLLKFSSFSTMSPCAHFASINTMPNRYR